MLNSFIEKSYLKKPNNLAYFDSLTGSYSRNYYDTIFKTKYHYEEVFIVFIDINGLRKWNLERNYHDGDELLKSVARCLDGVGSNEVCRTGDDEFVFAADKSFDYHNLNNIPNISYGFVIKDENQTVDEAVDIAREYMKKRKTIIRKRENKKKKKES